MIEPSAQRKAIAEFREAVGKPVAPVKVLVVEDDANDAAMTMASLKAVGVEGTWARDSAEIQNYLAKHEPWMVFLDLQLGAPVVGTEVGLNVLGFIKSFKPKTEVVILTGQHRSDSVYCIEAMARGARAVFLKPFTVDDAQFIFHAP